MFHITYRFQSQLHRHNNPSRLGPEHNAVSHTVDVSVDVVRVLLVQGLVVGDPHKHALVLGRALVALEHLMADATVPGGEVLSVVLLDDGVRLELGAAERLATGVPLGERAHRPVATDNGALQVGVDDAYVLGAVLPHDPRGERLVGRAGDGEGGDGVPVAVEAEVAAPELGHAPAGVVRGGSGGDDGGKGDEGGGECLHCEWGGGL